MTSERLAPGRASARFMFRHPAHGIALGLGSGLSPKAPGTVATLWAWASFLVIDPWLSDAGWAALLVAALAVGTWACTRTAQHLGLSDPGAIVWDEIVAFWLVLWLVMPAGWGMQAAAFALFRYFDAVKPGPVAWADGLFKVRPGEPIGWPQGFGILWDDLVAAGCTLLVLALGARAAPVLRAWWEAGAWR
jgi:phosphatidylglycerophosphatase A